MATTTGQVNIKNIKFTKANKKGTIKVTWGCSLKSVDHYTVKVTAWNGKSTITLVNNAKVKTKSYTKNIGAFSGLLYFTVYITPVKKSSSSEKWVGRKTGARYIISSTVKPGTPSAPTLELSGSKLIAYVDGSGGIEEYAQFQLYNNAIEGKLVKTSNPIAFGKDRRASYIFDVAQPGHKYRARVRLANGYKKGKTKKSQVGSSKLSYSYSAYSGYSSVVQTKPATPNPNKIKCSIIKELGQERVRVTWDTVTGADGGYEIELSSNQYWTEDIWGSVSTNIGSYIGDIPASGTSFKVRIRAKNSSGNSAWSGKNTKTKAYPSFILSKKPNPPTTWSLKDKIIIDNTDETNLYFTHNYTDGSELTDACVSLTIYSSLYPEGLTREIYRSQHPESFGKTTPASSEESPIYFYKLNTSEYVDSTEVRWKVKTKGANDSFSDYSTERIIFAYEEPVSVIRMNSGVVSELPVEFSIETSPASQTPLLYSISITALTEYERLNQYGNTEIVSEGQEIYSNTLLQNGENPFIFSIDSKDSPFADEQDYRIKVVVSFTSGLETKESTKDFSIKWREEYFECSAEIVKNDIYSSVSLFPKCVNLSFKSLEEYGMCEAGHPTQYEYEYSPGREHYYIYSIDENRFVQCTEYNPYDENEQYYEIVFNSEIFNENKTYYYTFNNDTGLYIQCSSDSEFDPDETYYKPLIYSDWKESLFNTDPDHYYIFEEWHQCESGEPFEETSYYEATGFMSASPQPTEEEYYAKPEKYYIYLEFQDEMIQCSYEREYSDEYDYQIPLSYSLISITESDYYERPTYYYINNRYTRCNVGMVYDATVIYYEPSSYKISENVSELDYNLDPRKYYILVEDVYEQCTPEIPYNEDAIYYIPDVYRDAMEYWFNANKTYYYYNLNGQYIQYYTTDVYDSTDIYYRPLEDTTLLLSDDVELSIYRREYDGQSIEIASGIPNDNNAGVTDLHPALNFFRYRIVARSLLTGRTDYTDIETDGFTNRPVIIQWDERGNTFIGEFNNEIYTDVEMESEPSISSMTILRLPYNIDVSESNSKDVALRQYIGRSNPVSYYGTQLGIEGNWKVEIEKSDTDTLYKLRKLSIYKGDVYVREPSGIGYWANINVDMSQTHMELTIPVTLSITRVEGDRP